jgi:16S rRNA (cytosine1402-N4)-methyltransferase
MTSFSHVPVLLKESISLLNIKPGGTYIDATLGGGGHAKAILEASKTAKLIGIDRDIDALNAAKSALKEFGERVEFIQANFSDLRTIFNERRTKIDGILFDLGVSSYQIDASDRGFSFREDAPLDMRMDRSKGQTAEEMINTLDIVELERIILEFGEERFFKRIASAIVRIRPIKGTLSLANIIKHAIPKTSPQFTTKSIARVFQAFRIAVNGELDSLRTALMDSIDLLAPQGRIVVISYHSLEDRIVKNTFKAESIDCICPPRQPQCTCDHKKKLTIITKKPVIASPEELEVNPRARSGKLRAAEHI